MDCSIAQNMLAKFVDGQLDANQVDIAQASALQGHLAGCGECRRAVEALRRDDALLRAAFAPGRAAAGRVAERVISQLSEPIEWTAMRASRQPRGAFVGRRMRDSRMGNSRVVQLLLAAAAGFLIALILFPPGKRPSDPPEPVAQLVVASGQVHARPSPHDEWQVLPDAASILPGYHLRTPPGVQCELRTTSGSVVRANSLTVFRCPSDTSVEVEQGQVWCRPSQLHGLQVASGDVAVTCRDGRFDVRRRGEETLVTATHGQIELAAGGKREELKAGEAAKIVGGQIVDRPEGQVLIENTRWLNNLLLLKGRDDAELRERVNDLLASLGASKMSHLSEQEIRSLGDYCVLPLTRFVQSPRSHSAGERLPAVRILADMAQPWSIPDLIALLTDADPQVRFYAAAALERLTGQTLGRTPQQWRSPWGECAPTHQSWQAWWQQHHKEFPACVSPPGPIK